MKTYCETAKQMFAVHTNYSKENSTSSFQNFIVPIQNQNIKKGDDILKYDGKTIKKRTNRKNEWYLRFYKNGQQKTVYGKTQKEVVKNYKLALKEQPKEIKQDISLKQWFEQYLQLFKIGKVTDTTLSKTKKEFEYLKDLYHTPIKDIEPFETQKILNKIKMKCTANKIYILLNALLSKAFETGLIPRNVMKLVDKPKYEPNEKIALTTEEEKIFIESCNANDYGDFYLLCLFEGLRKGECMALKVNDVDFNNMTLRIDESLNQHTTRTTTKNKQSNRIIPIFEKAKQILAEKIKDKKQSDLLFNAGRNKLDKILKQILKGLNIRHITAHTLRHTFITRCQEKNIPLYVIQAWVGHERGSIVTQKIYTHLNKETNSKYIDIFNGNC